MRRPLLCFSLLLLAASTFAEDNWPDYRGPAGNGHSAATGLPLTWNETTNVRWKTAIHGKGWSSPIVWGKQIWLTTATADGREMFVVCLDRDSGRILLDRKLFETSAPEPIHDTNSYASPSPVIEAGRVYVHYGRYGTACLDTRTFQTIWQRRDLPCRHSVGPGASPVLYGDLLILTMDGVDVQYMVALDKRTGKTAWKTDRSTDLGKVSPEERKSFVTPTLVTLDGERQLLSPGAQAIYAYTPQTGKERWRVRYHGYSSAARILLDRGRLIVCTGFDRPEMWAVRLGGGTDLPESNVVWKYARNVPAKASPLLIDDLIYMVSDSGMATCLEAATGAELWKERLGGGFSASPLYVDGRIYFCGENGKTTVIRPGRKFDVVAENHLPDGFMASPAVVGKAFLMRTKTHLYRIETTGN